LLPHRLDLHPQILRGPIIDDDVVRQSPAVGVRCLGLHSGPCGSRWKTPALQPAQALRYRRLDHYDDLIAPARCQLAEVALGENRHVEDNDGVVGTAGEDGIQFGVDGRVADGLEGLEALGVIENDRGESGPVDVAGLVEYFRAELAGDGVGSPPAWRNHGASDGVDIDHDRPEFLQRGSRRRFPRTDSTCEADHEHIGILTDRGAGALDARVGER
jgi:hypothetical protein